MTPEQSRARSQHAPDSSAKSGLRKFGIIALFVILGAAIVLAAFSARDWSAMAKARKLQNPAPPTPEALAAGKESYRKHCQNCHGEHGDGKGEKAPELSVAPGDFTDAQKMRRLTDGELYWQITRGRRPMPSFADKLSDEQRWQAVDYIRTFAGNAAR
jgi:mono/diheme cytochrome c family protein